MSPPPPNFHPSKICKWDLIWKQGLCRNNQFKMRSYWIRVGPKSKSNMTGVPLQEGKVDREIHRNLSDNRGRLGWQIYKSRTEDNYQKQQEARKDTPLELSKRACPCWHLDFGLQTFRAVRINFYYLKPPVCGPLLYYSSPWS